MNHFPAPFRVFQFYTLCTSTNSSFNILVSSPRQQRELAGISGIQAVVGEQVQAWAVAVAGLVISEIQTFMQHIPVAFILMFS